MCSYANNIQLPARAIRRIADSVQPLESDRLYSAFAQLTGGAHGSVELSFKRYISGAHGEIPE